MSEQIAALIVDPDTTTRHRLREALGTLSQVDAVVLAGGTGEAHSKIQESDRFDLVFIGDSNPRTAAQALLKQARSMRATMDAAFISVLSAAPEAAVLNADLLHGVDGFLVAPYSINSMTQMIEIAEAVRKDRRDLRLRAALQLLIQEIRSQVTLTARLLSDGCAARTSLELLREMCAALRDLPLENQSQYLELLLSSFSDRNGQPERYRGVSERVRSRFSRKAIQRLREAFAA